MHNPTNYGCRFMQYVMQRAKCSSSGQVGRGGEGAGERERKVVELVACGRCLASSLEIAVAR